MAWASEYMEKMTSTPGQKMMADTLGCISLERRQRCLQWQHEQLQLILSRAEVRGEAPLTYRISYAPQTLSRDCLAEWIGKTLT